MKFVSSFAQLFTCILVMLLVFTGEVQIDTSADSGRVVYEVSVVSEVFADHVSGHTGPTPPAAPTESTWLRDALVFLNAIIGVMGFIITPLIAFVGWLLSPDWTRGDLFGLNEGLYRIWVTISNITYFLYAIGLIGIALATIFNVENYTYRQLLPKLALGILIVPFTWWIVQAVVSVSSILAVSIAQIPYETLEIIGQRKGTNGWFEQESIPKLITYDNTGEKQQVISKGDNCAKLAKAGTPDKASCISPKQILTNASSGPYSVLTVYAYNIFKIQEIQNISNVAGGIKIVLQIFNHLVFGALIFLIFGILVIALTFALFARAFELWILTMFSPLLSLSIVLPDAIKGESFKEHISFSNLITLAMIPVYVSAALSFGVLILGLLMDSDKSISNTDSNIGSKLYLFGGQDSFFQLKTTDNGSDTSKTIRSIIQLGPETSGGNGTSINGGLRLEVLGTITNETETQLNKGTGFFDGAGGIFGTIILDVIGLSILWLALMGALGASKITKAAIDPFAKAGKSLGDLGKSLPKYTPIPGLGISPKGIEKLTAQAGQHYESTQTKKISDSRLGKMFSQESRDDMKDIGDFRVKMNQYKDKTLLDTDIQDMRQHLIAIANRSGTQSTQFQEAFKQFQESIKKNGPDNWKKWAENDEGIKNDQLTAKGYSLLYRDPKDGTSVNESDHLDVRVKLKKGGVAGSSTSSSNPTATSGSFKAALNVDDQKIQIIINKPEADIENRKINIGDKGAALQDVPVDRIIKDLKAGSAGTFEHHFTTSELESIAKRLIPDSVIPVEKRDKDRAAIINGLGSWKKIGEK